MPYISIKEFNDLGACAQCGAGKGRFCLSKNGKRYREAFVHEVRVSLGGVGRLVHPTAAEYAKLPTYPLAIQYLWRGEYRRGDDL